MKMKKLFLVRHAKSSWSIDGLADIDRPLNARGYKDAHLVSAHLKKEFSGKALFVSSPATRALTTAMIFMRALSENQEEANIDPRLYDTDADTYLEVIKSTGDGYDTVFVFGHNPTISEVFERLNGPRDRDLPTCAVAAFEFSCDRWPGILTAEKKLLAKIFPSHLKNKMA
jgi:phosphohistidine phosphatase